MSQRSSGQGSSRRTFIKTTAMAGAGYWVAGGVSAKESTSPNEQVNFACIGIGGKGHSDSADARKNGNVVAVCDIDESRLEGEGRRCKGAKRFFDYRKMLDEMGKSIDAVTVSTPDHTHAPAALRAMRMGKHCFTQKPLTHSLEEARLMATVAREQGVATQMGNQGTALPGLRKAAAMIQAGVLGKVSSVHCWTNRPVWPQGLSRPTEKIEIPSGLHWDNFLGSAPERPYAPIYHPFKWRGWWDFGTGALGDMACHTLNMAFKALDLQAPTTLHAETSGHNKETYPKWSIINIDFPERNGRAPVKLTWYDGGKLPPAELMPGIKPSSSGLLIVGEKGSMYSSNDYGAAYQYIGEVEEPEVEYEISPGHFKEWVRAIKGGPAAASNFPNYSGPLTETVLLGNLAVWADGKTIDWDHENLIAKNAPECEILIRQKYRKGFEI